ncbi:MAG: hypothetical protein GF384_01275, partial [Elusimicrobia bacterium]|nr:hypothetical protein [Elusimicrobiota bacterium]MBD3411665.1 hypothetical protein [Elusimicrobiota bacterium]
MNKKYIRHGILSTILIVLSVFWIKLSVYAEESSYVTAIQKFVGGTPYKIEVRNNYAYIAAYGVLAVYDVSNEQDPTFVSYLDLEGVATDIVVINTLAYIVAGEKGFHVVDISNPSQPTLQGSCSMQSGYARSLAVQGNYAYVAALEDGLRIINISEPTNPHETGPGYAQGIDCAMDVIVVGKYAYLADEQNNIIVINITDPQNPEKTGEAPSNGQLQNICYDSEYIYAADWDGSLSVYRITGPGTIEYVTSSPINGRAFDVFIKDHYAYVTNYNMGILEIFNVANVNNIQKIEPSVDLTSKPYHIAYAGSKLYITFWNDGFCLLDISNPEVPALISDVNEPGGTAVQVLVKDNYAYVADCISGFWVFDISDPDNASVVTNYRTVNYLRHMFIKDHYLYCAVSGSGLEIVDISDPRLPRHVSDKKVTGVGRAVCVDGQYAYVASDSYGINIVNVLHPENPQVIRTYETSGRALGITVQGDRCYVADWTNGLVVLDIVQVPTQIETIETINTAGYAYSVTVEGDYAYVSDHEKGFTIIDLVSQPHQIKNYDDYPALGMQPLGDYLYVSSAEDGIIIYKKSAAMTYHEIAYYDTPGYAFAAEFHGNNVYVCDNNAGFLVLRPHFPRVDSVSPGGVLQGQTKDITLSGKYFHAGATVNILGGDITVNETEFLTDSSLRINITVDPEAYMTLRDIYVENPNGFENTSHSLLQVLDGSPPFGIPSKPVITHSGGNKNNILVTWTKGSCVDPESGISAYIVQLGTRENPGLYYNGNVGMETEKAFTLPAGGTEVYARVHAINGTGLPGKFSEISDPYLLPLVQPVITEISPTELKRNSVQTTINIFGEHFTDPVSLHISGEGIMIHSVELISATLIKAIVSVSPDAELGDRSITVNAGGIEVMDQHGFAVIQGFTETSGDVAVQGGSKGYVNPKQGEQAVI